MIFPSGAMAVGGIVSRSVIRSDGKMPPGVLLSGKVRKKRCLKSLLKAGRVGVDERSEFQIFGATDENDLEVAMEVLQIFQIFTTCEYCHNFICKPFVSSFNVACGIVIWK